ncbi:MAG: hypothetical protein QNJ68_10415 [Microcoleaceae cyanobacterium MO_207.B10]|nr:hypothetical protein [Microcoleaceae cyanobacterium MO_207.B10]
MALFQSALHAVKHDIIEIDMLRAVREIVKILKTFPDDGGGGT